MNLNHLYNLSQAGIFALHSINTKEVYLYHSADILSFIARLVKDNRKFKNYDVVILETSHHHLDSQLLLREYYDIYRNNGFVVMNENPRLLQYTIKVEMFDNYRLGVFLVNRWRKRRLVGIFRNIREAENFLELYKQMPYNSRGVQLIRVVYAYNELTRRYFNERLL